MHSPLAEGHLVGIPHLNPHTGQAGALCSPWSIPRSHPSLQAGSTRAQQANPISGERSVPCGSQHTARAPSGVVLSQTSPGSSGEGALAAFSPPGADVIYEVQVTLGSSEHLFCRGLGGVLLTWEEFILTARNWGRLAQHILSLGVVNCWNSLLPFGMLQRREEGSLQGQEEGVCD